MAAYRARLQQFEDILHDDLIDLKKLREMCFSGIPDANGCRPLCWKILLNYISNDRSTWEKTLRTQRETYEQFVNEMIVNPLRQESGVNQDVTDHPLNPSPKSPWQTFFKDNETLLQIDKDVRRLCPDISFFQSACQFPCTKITEDPMLESLHKRVAQQSLKYANVTRNRSGITNITLFKKKAHEEYIPLTEGQEAHWEVVERILFIYAKLNPGQGYVQGMNEIIGPIYYTFASNPNKEWREYAEPDTFFCFTNIMAEIRDFFIKSLDDSSTGIGGMMNMLMNTLMKQDLAVYNKLKLQDVKPQYYSFRWLSLLLSQEFPLPDVIRVWDSFFADSKRFSFLIHVCCAMILLLHDQILTGDFSSNMKLLQNFPEMDIKIVLEKAVELSSR